MERSKFETEILKKVILVFDLDNTLVTSDMDFTWLREQIGCPLSSDLLSYVEQLECLQAREKAHSVILEHELSDAEKWAKKQTTQMTAEERKRRVEERSRNSTDDDGDGGDGDGDGE